ncbi:MAG: hypothetical protein ABUK01_00485 [Leptospirales bacterium]
MINKLIQSIILLLEQNLSAILDTPVDQTNPSLTVLPGKFSFVPGANQDRLQARAQQLASERDFNQEFFVKILAPDVAKSEEIAALAINIIITEKEFLLGQVNRENKATYQTGKYVSEIDITEFQFLEGALDNSGAVINFVMKFQAGGRLTLAKEAGPAEVIEKVVLNEPNVQ